MKAEFRGWDFVSNSKEAVAHFRVVFAEKFGIVTAYKTIECREELADTLEFGELYEINEQGELI